MFTQHTGRVTIGVRFEPGTAPIHSRYDWQGEIFPETGEIEFYPKRTDGTGDIGYRVKVTGPKVKKDGTASKTIATYEWSPGVYRNDADVPHVKAMYDAFIAQATAAIRPEGN